MTPSTKYKVFISEYAKTSNILQSALKAGFSDSYARKLGKRIVNTAMKIQGQELIDKARKQEITASEAKVYMNELIGMNRNEVFSQLKKIATQDKDYSSALKVLTPLSKELGVDITEKEQGNITVPVLNVVVSKPIETDNSSSIVEVPVL